MYDFKIWKLTPREHQVMDQLRRGASIKEAAIALDLSRGAVDVFLHTIRSKLAVKTNEEALVSYKKQLEAAYKLTLEQLHDKDTK